MTVTSTRHQNADGPANDDGGGALQQNVRDAERAKREARDNWDQAASRNPDAAKEGPRLDRGHTTSRDAGDDDASSGGEVPPGVGEQDLRDPGSRQAGGPPVKNRS